MKNDLFGIPIRTPLLCILQEWLVFCSFKKATLPNMIRATEDLRLLVKRSQRNVIAEVESRRRQVRFSAASSCLLHMMCCRTMQSPS